MISIGNKHPKFASNVIKVTTAIILVLLFGFCTLVPNISAQTLPKRPASGAMDYKYTASGLGYFITRHGHGRSLLKGDIVLIQLVARQQDGTIFEDTSQKSEPLVLELGKLFPGMVGVQEGVGLLHVGDRARFLIPPLLAFGSGAKVNPNFGEGTAFLYDVEVVAAYAHRISDFMFDAIENEGLKAAESQWRDMKERGFADVFCDPSDLRFLASAYVYRFFDLDAAEALYTWVEDLKPDDPDAEIGLGNVALLRANRSEALAHFARALKLQPGSARAAGQVAKLKADPLSPTALQRLSMLLEAPGYGGTASRRPMNMTFLREQLEAYLSAAPANGEIARLVALFQQKFDQYQEEERESFYRSLQDSGRQVTVDIVARGTERNRRIGVATASIEAQLDVALNFRFRSLSGEQIDLASYRGKPVMLIFWASWSQRSLDAMPAIKLLYKKYHPQGLEAIGIALDASPDNAEAVAGEESRVKTGVQVLATANQYGLEWPQAYDGKYFSGIMASQNWIDAVPRIILLGRDGKMAASVRVGEIAQLDEAIQRMTRAAAVPKNP